MEYKLLGSLVKRKIGYGIVQPGQSIKDGVPIIKVNNIINGLKSVKELETTTQSISEKYPRTLLHGGELIISVVGTIGKTAIVPESFAGCNLVRAVALIDIEDKIISKWVKYYLDSPYGKEYIHQNLNTTVQPTLNIKSLTDMLIPFYNRIYIEKAVSLLSGIDDKIALNNKINDNLEQQAFTLFEKIQLDSRSAECQVSDIAYLNPKRSLPKNQMARCVDMSQLSTSGMFPSGWQFKPFNGGMRFANGDTLLARITPCLENGKAAYINFLNKKEIAFGSTEYIVLAPKEGIPAEFLYCLVRYPAFVDYAVKNMNGTSGRQRVSADAIGKFVLSCPTKSVLNEFGNVVSVMFSKIKNNSLENLKLAALRDALLPKLMSGEIDVEDVKI